MTLSPPPRSAPLWLIADPAKDRPRATAGLSARFEVCTVPGIDAIGPFGDSCPFAILLTADHVHAATAIRRRHDLLADAPVLAFADPARPVDAATAAAIDEWLSPDLPEDAALRRVWAWLPPDPTAGDRLATTFGAEVVMELRSRFRDLLLTSMALIGSPTVADSAHRVAGIAGILGYAELGALWNADPIGDAATLRRETRKVVYALSVKR